MCAIWCFLQSRNSQWNQGVSASLRPLDRQIFKTASLWPLRNIRRMAKYSCVQTKKLSTWIFLILFLMCVLWRFWGAEISLRILCVEKQKKIVTMAEKGINREEMAYYRISHLQSRSYIIPYFCGRVNMKNRNFSKKCEKVLTFTAQGDII